MKSSFKDGDCIFLLKDLSDTIPFTPFDKKEELINNGISYSEMITREEPLSDEINGIFERLLAENVDKLALYVGVVAEELFRRGAENTIIVSLARAGSPIGALLRRYIIDKYNIKVPHYSISIIRGRGIDTNALDYIIEHHPEGKLCFVDGWTGKGSITKELKKSITAYNNMRRTTISDDLAVLADPAHLSAIAGTRDDICIPNACLNSTVSGLVSRTILNEKYLGPNDFHGAVRYDYLSSADYTNMFLDTIESHFTFEDKIAPSPKGTSNVKSIIKDLAKRFPLADINKVKLSIGESSRALIRRRPYVVLVKHPTNPDLEFILHMAKQREVEILPMDFPDYECITLLR